VRHLIVNADDFGVTRGVSEGIRRAHLAGIVTTTTAMMNMPDAAPELQRARDETPRLGLGVHLTLTAGRPLSPSRLVASLVDSAGAFVRPPEFRRRMGNLNLEEVEREWRAQIEAFLHLGLTLDHLDSHHHSSYLSPSLVDLLLEVASGYACAVRTPVTDGESEFVHEVLEAHAPDGATHAEEAMRTTTVPHAEVFVDSFFDATATLEGLLAILNGLPDGSSEIMCHPGMVDDDLKRASDYSTMRAHELEILTDPRVRRAIEVHAIRLCRYADLHG
jgi:chitin disaccharide deacetylase